MKYGSLICEPLKHFRMSLAGFDDGQIAWFTIRKTRQLVIRLKIHMSIISSLSLSQCGCFRVYLLSILVYSHRIKVTICSHAHRSKRMRPPPYTLNTSFFEGNNYLIFPQALKNIKIPYNFFYSLNYSLVFLC